MERFAGRFSLVRPLGQGGMGDVHLARNLETGANCALKRLSARFRSLAPKTLENEFETLTRVRHPVIVAVDEFGLAPDGTPYLTMEYVPGVPADQAGLRGNWAALAFVAAEVALGLDALHSAGVIHGDIKPSNLLVVRGGRDDGTPASVRLLDFGLAGILGRHRAGRSGTPGFAAPEVVNGEAPNEASDLYGLGALLFALACGHPAFEAADQLTLLHVQQAGPPPARPLAEAGAPAAFIELVLRLMAPDPSERPMNAAEVREELARMHPAARRPLAARLETTRVVGRERDLAALNAVLGRSWDGRMLVLVGDTGSGKSALLGEFAVQVALAGRLVIRLSCASSGAQGAMLRVLTRRFEAESGWAGEAERDAAGEAERDAAGEPGNGAADEAGNRPHGETESADHDLEPWVTRAATALARIALTRGEPVVALDDADLLDPLSLAGLHRLLLHRPRLPVRWVLARRNGLDDAADEERLLVEIGTLVMRPLGPLDPSVIATLASSRLGAQAPQALVDFLIDRAAGHPGLTVELLREAAREHVVSERDGHLIVDAARLAVFEPLTSLDDVSRTRFAMLSQPARSVAAALATLGRSMSREELTALVPEGAEAGERELEDQALALRDEAGRLIGIGSLLGQRALDLLSEDERRAWHTRTLALPTLSPWERFRHRRALGESEAALIEAEEAFARSPDHSLAAEAAALAEAHAPIEAARWHERAARRLAASGRYERAIPHWERAMQLDPAPGAREARAYGLSSALLRAGALDRAEALISGALALGPSAATAARLTANRASAALSQGRHDLALALATEAASTAEAAGDREGEALAAEILAALDLVGGRLDAAEHHVRRAASAYLLVGHVLGEIRSLGFLGWVALARQQLDSAQACFRETVALARARGSRLALEEQLVWLAGVQVEAGAWNDARAAYDEALGLALEDGRQQGAAIAVTGLALCDALLGRARSAWRRARAARTLTRRHYPRQRSSAWRVTAMAARIRGRLALALRAADRALRLAPATEPDERLWSHIERARAGARIGGGLDVEGVLLDALREAGGVRSHGGCIAQLMLAAAEARRGALASALERLRVSERWLEEHPRAHAAALALEVRALLAFANRREREGVEAGEAAIAAFDRLPAPADRASAALDLAAAALRVGFTDAPGSEWLDSAAHTFERMGDREGLLAALGQQVDWLRRARPRRPGLTQELNLIESVSRLLHSLADRQELTQRAMQLAVEQLDAERGALLWIESEGAALEAITEYGPFDFMARREALGYSRLVTQRVTESGSSMLVGDAPSDRSVVSDSVTGMRLRSILCVPMFLNHRVVGAVYLDDSRRAHAFTEEDRRLLEGFASLMAVAIDKSRGHERTEQVRRSLEDENLSLRQQASGRLHATQIIGTSAAMKRVLTLVEQAARNPNTRVLLTGENGTGKELIARTLHEVSNRRGKRFVGLNCGAIPETLIESELFGIQRRVATGVDEQIGRFLEADGGTLFLDEIGEMPLNQQVKLLSAIANREITPLGGGQPIPVDVRIIAASNRDLRAMVAAGTFREDLYYRLNVFEIELPALRERKADIPALAQHFVERFAAEQQREAPELSPEFMAALMQSDWPGNVRGLMNYVERVLAQNEGPVLYPFPRPRDLQGEGHGPKAHAARMPERVGEVERGMIEEALTRAGGNQTRAAAELGITEQSLRYRLRKLGIKPARENQRIRRFRRM